MIELTYDGTEVSASASDLKNAELEVVFDADSLTYLGSFTGDVIRVQSWQRNARNNYVSGKHVDVKVSKLIAASGTIMVPIDPPTCSLRLGVTLYDGAFDGEKVKKDQAWSNDIILNPYVAYGPATEETPGLMKMAENQAESEATTVAALKTDFNALLAKMVAAGIMAEGESE